MSRSRIPMWAALALLAAASQDWRLRLPLMLSPGVPLQQVRLPVAAIVALQRADGGDVRVLDARGRAQPVARSPDPAPPTRRVPIDAIPILGASDALKVTGVSLRIDDGSARVVQLDGTPAAGEGAMVLGMLFDTRSIDGPVHDLSLDVIGPANQPVTLTLESSADLRTWTSEAEQVLFRTGTNGPVVLSIGHPVRGQMLRLRWVTQGRLLAPLSIAGASLSLAISADTTRLAVRATLPSLADPHRVAFTMPLAAAPAAVRIELENGGTPVAVRLYGRQDREQSWTPIGEGIAAARGLNGAPISLAGSYREWEIRADATGDGFAAPPTLELRFAPRALAFVAAGTPPYTLAVGQAAAGAAFLPVTTLTRMAGDRIGNATLPAVAPPSLALSAPAGGTPGKTWLLWGVLLLGVAALGAMAWTLARPKKA